MSFFEVVKYGMSIVIGFLSYLFNGFDGLACLLMAMIVIDVVTGLMKAVYTKTLDSKIMFLGAFKKFSIIIIVYLTTMIDKSMIVNFYLRDAIIAYFVASEGLSVIENVSIFIDVPPKLKQFFSQLKNNENEDEKGDNDD